MHIWQDIFYSAICEIHSDYGDRTEDVAVIIATFSFSYTSCFSYDRVHANNLFGRPTDGRTDGPTDGQTQVSMVIWRSFSYSCGNKVQLLVLISC